MDYKAGGELFTHLQRDGGRFEESKVQFYIAEIILALDFLHSANIVYRDLKPENCLLDGSGHVVLCDFGELRRLGLSATLAHTLIRCHRSLQASREAHRPCSDALRYNWCVLPASELRGLR